MLNLHTLKTTSANIIILIIASKRINIHFDSKNYHTYVRSFHYLQNTKVEVTYLRYYFIIQLHRNKKDARN